MALDIKNIYNYEEKKSGDLIRSNDWNNMGSGIVKTVEETNKEFEAHQANYTKLANNLNDKKLDKTGGAITGSLSVAGDIRFNMLESKNLSGGLWINSTLKDGKPSYINNGYASLIQMDSNAGALVFRVSDTGAMNSNIKWKTPLTISKNGNIGIGTSNPLKQIHIQEGQIIAPLLNETKRPGIALTGQYPEINLFSSVNNTMHGPTIRLGSYNSSSGNDTKQWVLGTSGQNSKFLDIGFSTANNGNPHNGIRNFSGSTFLTILENGNVGVGTLAPLEKLQVMGNLNVSGNIYGKLSSPDGKIVFNIDNDGYAYIRKNGTEVWSSKSEGTTTSTTTTTTGGSQSSGTGSGSGSSSSSSSSSTNSSSSTSGSGSSSSSSTSTKSSSTSGSSSSTSTKSSSRSSGSGSGSN